MRLFNQRRDVGMGFMPAKLVAGPHQIAVSAPAAVRAEKGPARRVIAIIAFGTGRTRPAFLVPFDLDPAFGLVLDHAGLFTVFPIAVALFLGFPTFGFGNAPRLAQDHPGLASLDAPIHHLARDLMIDVPDPADRLRLLPGHCPLGLLLTPGTGFPMGLVRLLIGTLLLPSDLLRHDGPSVDHQAGTVGREKRPSPALARISGCSHRFQRSVGYRCGSRMLGGQENFVEQKLGFENCSGILAQRDRKSRGTVPASQSKPAARPRHQVAAEDNGLEMLLSAPGIAGRKTQFAVRTGGLNVPEELPHRLLNTSRRQPYVAVLAPDEVCVECLLRGPLPAGFADALMQPHHVVPQRGHRAAHPVAGAPDGGCAMKPDADHAARAGRFRVRLRHFSDSQCTALLPPEAHPRRKKQNRNWSKAWAGGIVVLKIPDAEDATSGLSFAERVDEFHIADPLHKEDARDGPKVNYRTMMVLNYRTMIGHDLQFQDHCLMFRSHFTKDGFQPCGDLVVQHFPAVLGAPNNMIFARIHNIAITPIYNRCFSRTHVLYYTFLCWIVNQFRRFPPPPYIPSAEARGFTAGLVNCGRVIIPVT